MQTKQILSLAALLVGGQSLFPQLSTVLAQGTAFTYQGRLSDGDDAQRRGHTRRHGH